MSKGHLEALRALRELRVTKAPDVTIIAPSAPEPKPNIVTEPKRGRGRPKVHASGAERVRACRARKKSPSVV